MSGEEGYSRQRTDLLISSLSTSKAPASISSSSLKTSRWMYELRSLPNSFQISLLISLCEEAAGAGRRFTGGGDMLEDGDRGRFFTGCLLAEAATLEGAGTDGREAPGTDLAPEETDVDLPLEAAFEVLAVFAGALALGLAAGGVALEVNWDLGTAGDTV